VFHVHTRCSLRPYWFDAPLWDQGMGDQPTFSALPIAVLGTASEFEGAFYDSSVDLVWPTGL